MLTPRLVACAVVLPLSACSQNDQSPITDQRAQAATSGCTPPNCGRPTVIEPGCTFFWRLNSNGLPNDHNASMVEVRRADGREMRLLAVVDRLRGVDSATNATLAEHQDLVGTTIIVSVHGSRRTITIDLVTTGEHFQVGAQSSIEAYDMSFVPLTSNGTATTKVRMIVFTGDDYDPVTKHVQMGNPAAGWMNFACIHSTLYEMHTLGHTAAASIRLGIQTTIAKRQALFDALTGNVCDLGLTWAAPSQPITLVESQSLLPVTSRYLAPSASYESIWTANGAV